MIKIAFDVGGVLSKYPVIFKKLMKALVLSHEAEIYIISDMHNKTDIIMMLEENDIYYVKRENIYSADYNKYVEKCKAKLCEELEIDILIDDWMGYLVDGKHIRLLVMPDTSQSYYSDEWRTDGSEGNFGRRKPQINDNNIPA